MPTVEMRNYEFEYVEQGSGEPLVFVHGSASDHRTWQIQQDVFSTDFRTLAYSRRYHWPNEPIADGADYAMDEHVDDLQEFLGSLDAAPAHLVGHSYGAFVCLLLAIRAPHLVRRLVLAEPPVITLFVSNSPKPSELLKLLISRPRTAISIIKFGATGMTPAAAAAERGDVEEAMQIFGRAVLGDEAYRQLSASRLEQVRANSMKAEFLGSGFAPLDADQVRSVDTPTLLINGERSPSLFHCLMDRIEELLPHAERIEIPGASHIIHEDNAPAYNAAIRSFLARHREVVSAPA